MQRLTEPNDALLSSRQMADLMGVSIPTLSRWRCEGGGGGPPFIRISEKRAAYSLRAYREWVDAQTVRQPARRSA